jgi:aldehyde dehydrogenase (NAD+)
LLIDGELCDAADGAEFPIENPATGELIGHAPDAGATDADAAIAAAHAAFQEQPGPPTRRCGPAACGN